MTIEILRTDIDIYHLPKIHNIGIQTAGHKYIKHAAHVLESRISLVLLMHELQSSFIDCPSNRR